MRKPTKITQKLELACSFEAFFARYPNKMNKVAAKRFWIEKLRPYDGSPFLEEITDGLEAHLEWGCLRSKMPPNAINFLMDQRWKDPLPPTVRQLTRDYEADPVGFLKEYHVAAMKCVQRGWGFNPTPRQEALSAMRIPIKWLLDNNFSVDPVRV